jgi:hypothetical protein
MRLYSKKNKNDDFDLFNIDICLPKINYGIHPENAWGTYPPTKYIDIHLDTKFVYQSDESYWYLTFTLIGFGFSVTRQTGY